MKNQNKNISVMLAIIMLINVIFPTLTVLADNENSSSTITGDYQYSASEGNNIQNHNTFVYHDDCFARSSFLGCKHLEVLSIQAAASSISYYGSTEDPDEISVADNAYNIIDLLTKMEFEDVETNTYYTTEKQENSMGVAVGHKTIVQEENDYTLLAIVPRSAGYKQEWVGNFTVGSEDIHEGFKAARDEILRFVKKYITEHQIEGSLKVWISGYSRGAAVSDLLGGFFAGGGIEYFGESVSITPEDVYCYTIGTPKNIKNGASKNEELSVSGNREEPEYANDTPGEEYRYTKGGIVSIGDDIYGGLHNLISPLDSFPLLPLEEWGFTRYGNTINPNEGLTSEEDMLEELQSISPYLYAAYTEEGLRKPFKMKTFDITTLSITETGETMLPSDFIKERLHGMSDLIDSNATYTEEYQEALKALIGIYGMGATFLNGGFSTGNLDNNSLFNALLTAYLAYASECFIQENRAQDDMEAAVRALADLLNQLTEEEIEIETYTIDDFVALFAKYFAEHEAIKDVVVTLMANNIPEDYLGFIVPMFGQFHKDFLVLGNDLTLEDALEAYIKACYYGADPESLMAADYSDPKDVRGTLYMILALVLSAEYPEIPEYLYDEDLKPTGPGLLKDFMAIMLEKMMVVKDENNEIVKEYDSFAELADDSFIEILDAALEEPIERSRELYGDDYQTAFRKHVNNLKNNITNARRILSKIMFYTKEDFNIAESVESVSTFIDNAMQIPIEHFDEIYLAKARNSERYDEHIFPIDPIAESEEPVYHTVTFELNQGILEELDENTITIADNETIEAPKNPTRLGYLFSGWYEDEQLETKFDFTVPIVDDITIYAKWTKKSSSGSSKREAKENKNKTEEVVENNSVNTSVETPVTTIDSAITKESGETTEILVSQEEIWSNADEWAKEELISASSKKLIPETFAKKDFTKTISRQDFAAVCVKLYEAFTKETVEGVLENPFIDTDDEYVLKAYSLGITNGVSDNEFGNGEVTREQMATMLTRVLKIVGIDTAVDENQIEIFKDDSLLHDWGRESVYFMASNGIIKGIGNNVFNSLGKAKMEEALLITNRCID